MSSGKLKRNRHISRIKVFLKKIAKLDVHDPCSRAMVSSRCFQPATSHEAAATIITHLFFVRLQRAREAIKRPVSTRKQQQQNYRH